MKIDLKHPPQSRMMIDTSVLILHVRGKGESDHLMRWAAGVGTPFVSAVSIVEVTQGMGPREEEATRMLLNSLEPIDVTRSLAWDAGVLLRDLRKTGLTIHLPDALIAASARRLGVPVLTHNAKHFDPVGELEVLDARNVHGIADSV